MSAKATVGKECYDHIFIGNNKVMYKKMVYGNGNIYEGEWFYSTLTGKGKMIYKGCRPIAIRLRNT